MRTGIRGAEATQRPALIHFEPLAQQLRGYQRDIEEVKGSCFGCARRGLRKPRRTRVLDSNRLAIEFRARRCRIAIAEHYQGIVSKLHTNIGDLCRDQQDEKRVNQDEELSSQGS